MAKSKRRSTSDGTALVTAFRMSGKTQKQFAESNDVTVCTLQYWLAKAKRMAIEKSAVRFVEVVGTSSNDNDAQGGVVMDLGAGIRLTFESLPSPSYLSSVAAAFARVGGC